MLAYHSHVPGVALQFEDGRGEAEPLVAVPSQDVPLRNNVVRGGTHQLVAVSTPTAHTHTKEFLIFHLTIENKTVLGLTLKFWLQSFVKKGHLFI